MLVELEKYLGVWLTLSKALLKSMRIRSAVFDETTEGGRLFHKGIVRGKREFFRASL